MSHRPTPIRLRPIPPSGSRLPASLSMLAVVLLIPIFSPVLTPPALWGQPAGKTLLVDDFDDGDLEARSGLSWVPFSDDQFGGTSEAHVEVIDDGAEGSRHALRFSGRTTEVSERKIAAVWVPVAEEGLPKDLSAYDGVRFFARGDGQTFHAGVRRGLGRLANYTHSFTVPEDWTRIEVPYAELAKNPRGATTEDWTPEDISWVGFSVPTDFVGSFVLDVDSVELYRGPEGEKVDAQADKRTGRSQEGAQ